MIPVLQSVLPKMNFYRFCQLLERYSNDSPPLGSTSSPVDDRVRFRPHPGMGFPVSELKAIEQDEDHPQRPLTVRTTFLGLYGVDSPLPSHYLDDISQRREGHEAVEDFLDIFNHRVMTQYYRIWRKYAYPASFAEGGVDDTSQCLLGLIGLGIPGSSNYIATPVSRFLALLGTMRLPTRTREGVISLVQLLAPGTTATVTPHYPKPIPLNQPTRLSRETRTGLSQRAVLGKRGTDVNSMLHLQLYTEQPDEAQGWLPGGQLHTDLLILLRVYLGYRCQARLQLTLPRSVLPDANLRQQRKGVQLGRTAVLGFKRTQSDKRGGALISINLGDYQGLTMKNNAKGAVNGGYRF